MQFRSIFENFASERQMEARLPCEIPDFFLIREFKTFCVVNGIAEIRYSDDLISSEVRKKYNGRFFLRSYFSLHEFLRHRVRLTGFDEDFVQRGTLLSLYESWCENNSLISEVGPRLFATRIEESDHRVRLGGADRTQTLHGLRVVDPYDLSEGFLSLYGRGDLGRHRVRRGLEEGVA